MILYHTVRLTGIGVNKTVILDIETLKSESTQNYVLAILDDYNKKGYQLTAVNGNDYYLTKRVD